MRAIVRWRESRLRRCIYSVMRQMQQSHTNGSSHIFIQHFGSSTSGPLLNRPRSAIGLPMANSMRSSRGKASPILTSLVCGFLMSPDVLGGKSGWTGKTWILAYVNMLYSENLVYTLISHVILHYLTNSYVFLRVAIGTWLLVHHLQRNTTTFGWFCLAFLSQTRDHHDSWGVCGNTCMNERWIERSFQFISCHTLEIKHMLWYWMPGTLESLWLSPPLRMAVPRLLSIRGVSWILERVVQQSSKHFKGISGDQRTIASKESYVPADSGLWSKHNLVASAAQAIQLGPTCWKRCNCHGHRDRRWRGVWVSGWSGPSYGHHYQLLVLQQGRCSIASWGPGIMWGASRRPKCQWKLMKHAGRESKIQVQSPGDIWLISTFSQALLTEFSYWTAFRNSAEIIIVS